MNKIKALTYFSEYVYSKENMTMNKKKVRLKSDYLASFK